MSNPSLKRAVWLVFTGSKQEKYEARHRIVSFIAKKSGFRVYNRNLMWPNDDEFRLAWNEFPYGDGKYIHERKFNFYYIAKAVRNIPGELAECGVFHGGSSHLMLVATRGTKKHLFGFDSFDGLSEPAEVDASSREETFKWKKHDMRMPEDIARANLHMHHGRFTLYKGWIPERFHEVEDKNFCLVHIDVDLYEPTLKSLEFFYPRMTSGGIIVCDDYGSEACPGAYKAMNDFFNTTPENGVIHLTTGQGMVIVQAK